VTPYPEIRRLVLELESDSTAEHLEQGALAGIFRARILRSLPTPEARQRRRGLLLIARAYLSLARIKRGCFPRPESVTQAERMRQ